MKDRKLIADFLQVAYRRLCRYMAGWTKFKNHIANENGFSLVEAIVSVVILGIAVIPISMVFTQTINTTISTRKQYEASELGQQYIEALKNKSMADMALIFGGSTTTTLSHLSDTNAIGLSQIPEGYEVILTYDDTIDLAAYEMPSANPPLPVDVIISVERNTVTGNNELRIGDGSGTLLDTFVINKTASSSHHIKLNFKRSVSQLSINYWDSNSLIDGPVTVNLSEYAVRFVAGNDMDGLGFDIGVELESDIPSTSLVPPRAISFLVYESQNEDIIPNTSVTTGEFQISRNLQSIAATSNHRIIGLNVQVKDMMRNKIISDLRTTKIQD